MTAPTEDPSTMSAECALAQQPGYSKLHSECRQTRDIPLPHGRGILLIPRCTCPHHRYSSPR
ncbi:hypothetical protein [Streptomyces sp. GbtcB6]|uniref:hypothetical protein n=1 Tax=Streptomyces sp. GbtcB6 TaxID=2824751 RepID=UPI001C301CA6|nr:hypothetical protein [Streptomyces sp. GbtcB6]